MSIVIIVEQSMLVVSLSALFGGVGGVEGSGQ